MKGRIFILTGESPEKPGGMEHVVREVKRALEDHDYAVEVLHRHNSAPNWVARPSGKWQGYLADIFLSFYLGTELRKRVGRDTISVLSNGLVGWYMPGIPSQVKKMHFYHGTYRGQADAIKGLISPMGAWKLKWWDSMVLEKFSGRAKLILCNSEQTHAEVLRFFGFYGKTVLNPMDLQRFKPHDQLEARKRLGLTKDKKIGIFVGSTEPTKGFPVVRCMIAALPEVKWILALRGNVPEDLKTNSQIAIYADASPDILPLLYSAADFAICPSRYEAFGYVVAEALACGTPVVSSMGGASRFLLADSPLNGCLVSRADAVNEYLSAIQAILEDPHYRKVVISLIRPKLAEAMSPEKWSSRFFAATGL